MALPARSGLFVKTYEVAFRLSGYLASGSRYASKAHSAKQWKKMTREERYMKKLVEGLSQTKRRKGVYLQKLSFADNNDRSRVTVSPGMVKRANQLSAVLQENIFYCLCYEDVCPDLLKYNVEISKVKITPDLNNLNIYWTATGNRETDDEIEHLVKASRGRLRSALTKKRILNRVPPVQFIKDVKSAYAKHVDELIKKADMGSDHSSDGTSSDLKLPLKRVHSGYGISMNTPEADIRRLGKKFQHTEYTMRDGPGAKLVIGGTADFGASSTLYSDTPRLSEKTQSADHEADSWNPNAADSYSAQDGRLSLKLRNDIYDLDHGTLLMQVLRMKKQMKERGSLPETETSRKKALLPLKSRHLDAGHLDSQRIHKLLKESIRRSRHKVGHLDDIPMREDWQNEQLKLINQELDDSANWQDDDDDNDSSDILEDFDYILEQEGSEK